MAKRHHLELNEAIALVMEEGEISQAELARRLDTARPNVNRWVNGVYSPSIEDVPRIEDACGARRGRVLELAGYVECPETVGVLEAVERDHELDATGKAIMTVAYESARSYNRKLGRQTEEALGD